MKILKKIFICFLVVLLVGCGANKDDSNPVIKLGDYKNLNFDVDTSSVVDVTDEDFIAYMTEMLSTTYAKKDIITNGIVNNGDTITINYVIKDSETNKIIENVNNYEIIVGSNDFLDGFDEAVTGLEIGKTVNYKSKFPDDFWGKQYAGKTVKFKVEVVNKIINIPQKLTDKFVAENTDYKNIEELKTAFIEKSRALEEYELVKSKGIENLNKVIDETIFNEDLLNDDFNKKIKQFEEYFVNEAEALNLSLDECALYKYNYNSYNEFLEEYKNTQKYLLKRNYILLDIAKKEKIEATEEAIDLVLVSYIGTDLDIEDFKSVKDSLIESDPVLYNEIKDMALIATVGQSFFLIEANYFYK